MKKLRLTYVVMLLCALAGCKDDTSDAIDSTTTNNTTTTKIINAPWTRVCSYIIYDSDNTTETYKRVIEYDSQRREIGEKEYENGTLSSVYRDYTYNGQEVTYLIDNYVNGVVGSTGKAKKTYCDDGIRLKLYILYNSDNTEGYKEVTEYDSQSRVVGLKQYNNGSLLFVYRDYTYNGQEAPFYLDHYTNGVVSSTWKEKITFYDDGIRVKSMIHYGSDNITETSEQIREYDSQGREIGSKISSNGSFSYVCRDYTYNGKEVTYYMDHYTNGAVKSTQKIKKIFY